MWSNSTHSWPILADSGLRSAFGRVRPKSGRLQANFAQLRPHFHQIRSNPALTIAQFVLIPEGRKASFLIGARMWSAHAAERIVAWDRHIRRGMPCTVAPPSSRAWTRWVVSARAGWQHMALASPDAWASGRPRGGRPRASTRRLIGPTPAADRFFPLRAATRAERILKLNGVEVRAKFGRNREAQARPPRAALHGPLPFLCVAAEARALECRPCAPTGRFQCVAPALRGGAPPRWWLRPGALVARAHVG